MYNNTAIAHHVVPHFLLSKNKALLSEYLQNLWLVNPKFARKQIQYTAMLNVVPNVVSNVVPFVVLICCTHLLCAPCLFSTILTLDYLPKKNKHPKPLIYQNFCTTRTRCRYRYSPNTSHV